ncbi:hypothetical protein RDI58_002548 [Solanum bulbocastanum]|uniref:Uncharacterized protein n=1 Tax=Solanum bulbocastanum TaxID=147425 RepID=A0AAN8YR88_SOLBU
MIHRKWSLLTGPAAILSGIVGTIVVANFIFIQNSRSFHSPQISDGEFLISPPSFSNVLQKLLVFSPVRLSNSNCCVGDVTQDAPWVISRDPFLKPERKLEKAPSTK